jgi:DeoR/GlpR family transcriptional regulator of sugar metabolism
MASSSKYGSFAKYRVLRLQELDVIITDDGFAVDDLKDLPADGTKVIRAAGDTVADNPATAPEMLPGI